jgi:hypothetical protein
MQSARDEGFWLKTLSGAAVVLVVLVPRIGPPMSVADPMDSNTVAVNVIRANLDINQTVGAETLFTP